MRHATHSPPLPGTAANRPRFGPAAREPRAVPAPARTPPPVQRGDLLDRCIEDCRRCQRSCLSLAMTQCLAVGDPRATQEQFRLMLNCAELAQTAANFMLSDAVEHIHVCRALAEVAAGCADACEAAGGLEECVNACRNCAASCRAMTEKC